MSIRAVGLCGVDDSVDVELLRLLAARYPAAEFGVLFREDKQGTPRYPSQKWLAELAEVAATSMPPLRLAAHLCGSRCSDVLKGDTTWVEEYLVPFGFKRVQINATAINGVEVADMSVASSHLEVAISKVSELEWILQANEETKLLWEPFLANKNPPENVSILFDASCGKGTLITTLPSPPANGIPCGYAGGLGPESIGDVIQKLRAGVANEHMIWLDMESKLRSTLDGQDVFNIAKAQAVCKVVAGAGWVCPGADEVDTPLPPNVHVSAHPLLAHKMTKLRDGRTPPRVFRTLLREITFHLGYEATASMLTAPVSSVFSPVGPVADTSAVKLVQSVAMVPVLRAGLGMVDAMLELLPNAVVHHLGMFRPHSMGLQQKPIEYYSRLPKDGATDLAFVLDPMIATSRTCLAAVEKLKGWGAKQVVVLCACASREGVARLHELHPDVPIYAASVDNTLRRDGYIAPGLGDAGDRLYSTPDKQRSVYDSASAGLAASPPRPPRREDEHAHAHKPITQVLGEGHAAYKDPASIPPAHTATPRATDALTTHNTESSPALMNWGGANPELRGPVLATIRHPRQRNVIGAHAGGYSVYRALASVTHNIDDETMPKLGLTTPVARIGPFPAWHDPKAIVTMDPYGHAISEAFGPWLERGYDIRPTIAVTKAHIELPECKDALRTGRLQADGAVLSHDGQSFVTKCAVEPVWYLPGIAERFGVPESELRQAIFKETNSMYPELLTRNDLKVFLPPIGGLTVYIWGDPSKIPDESVELTCRVHDECNGSDVFGSDICTCRPYLTHAIEECIRTAQNGGTGIAVYFRKEGRALGEVTKYLVYNMRKRQDGGDKATEYFNCTKEVAGVTDTRFQVLMPDVLRWLGVTKIHNFISMSDMKYDAIVNTGIKIEKRVEIPPELVPKDAQVEMAAKVFAGYHAGDSYQASTDIENLKEVKGREYSSSLSFEQSVREGGGHTGGADGAKTRGTARQ